MAGGLLFVSQALLDSWADQGKIDFVGNVMTLLQGEGKGRSYALEPAVRFLKVIGTDQDPHKLLAKVKQVSQLREMGAEHVESSVILGEVGYEVEPGFLAETSALQAAAAAPASAETGKAHAREGAVRHAPPRPTAQAVARSLSPAGEEGEGGSSAPGAPPQARPGARPLPLPRELEEKRKEAEALARFLLDNLS